MHIQFIVIRKFYLKRIIVTKCLRVWFPISSIESLRFQSQWNRTDLSVDGGGSYVVLGTDGFARGRRWMSSSEEAPDSLTVFMLNFETRGRKYSGKYTCISDLYYIASELAFLGASVLSRICKLNKSNHDYPQEILMQRIRLYI